MEDVEKNELQNMNQSCEKALRILEYLAESKSSVRLMDLAKDLGYNASTTLRFLNSFQRCGYVAQDADTQKYFLTFKICRISHLMEASVDIPKITHPFLIRLSNFFQESICISSEHDLQMVYLDVVTETNQAIRSFVRVGNIVPMHCTGNGKLILSTYTEDKIDRLIAERGLKKYTDRTLITKEQLMADLEKVRINGYAEVAEEREIGMHCFSYPIYNYTGKIFAGISVTGPSERVNMEQLGARLPELKKAAEEISYLLGYCRN